MTLTCLTGQEFCVKTFGFWAFGSTALYPHTVYVIPFRSWGVRMVVGFLRWFSGSLASSKSKWCSARQVWRWQCPPSGEAMFSHWFRPTTDGDGPDKDEEEMPPAQELEVLGSQPLSTLVDQISCLYDRPEVYSSHSWYVFFACSRVFCKQRVRGGTQTTNIGSNTEGARKLDSNDHTAVAGSALSVTRRKWSA